MTAHESIDPTPDGLTGAIMAVEGIRDAAVLLNGPTGCKFYHGALSDGQFFRDSSMDPLQFSEEFYFGQPRVPATYMDNHDYVFGSTDKLRAILERVTEKGHGLVAVVNSPGAALIGDDLERFILDAGLPIPCIAIQTAGFSESFGQGFQYALIRLLESLLPLPATAPGKSVNLLGLSIFHQHWEGNVAELQHLLGLCGISIHTVVSAGCSVESLRQIGAADANLVIHAEYADKLARFLEKRFGQPSLIPEQGAPVGFDATEKWIRAACTLLGSDPAPALAEVKDARKRAYHILSRFNSLTGLPRGATFALQANSSTSLPMVRWLYEYLGMVPISVSVEESAIGYAEALRQFLHKIGCEDAWEAGSRDLAPDLVFGGGGFVSRFWARNLPVIGVDIALPGTGLIEVVPRRLMGATGALWLLESIINGMAV